MLILMVLWLCASLWLFYLVASFIFKRIDRFYSKRFIANGTKAVATVTDDSVVSSEPGRSGWVSGVAYQFVDDKGDTIVSSIANSSRLIPYELQKLKNGDRFFIVYNPRKPSENYPEVSLKQAIKKGY